MTAHFGVEGISLAADVTRRLNGVLRQPKGIHRQQGVLAHGDVSKKDTFAAVASANDAAAVAEEGD